MVSTSIRFGNFSVDTGTGTKLINHVARKSVYFQPGDDSGDFHDRLEAASDAAPDRNYDEILAELWDDYAEIAESTDKCEKCGAPVETGYRSFCWDHLPARNVIY